MVTTATTGSSGVYDIPWVETGVYSVTFTKTGFETVLQNNVDIHVGFVTVDATMKVGSVATTITVTSTRELLQTESSEKNLALPTTQVEDLPNVGHDYGAYMLLVPGANPGQGGAGDFSNGANIGINGSQAAEASFLLDGGTFTYPGSYNGNTGVPLEDIGKVNINASNMGAEYGNGMFSFSVITKSGTNQFHGSGFEFVQNNVFNSRNFLLPHGGAHALERIWRHDRRPDQERQGVLLFQLPAQPRGGLQRLVLYLSHRGDARRQFL